MGIHRPKIAVFKKIQTNPQVVTLPVLAVTAYAMTGDRRDLEAWI